jgi:ubiquinone/menaquinone biosynthesis C-methylase UbiE
VALLEVDRVVALSLEGLGDLEAAGVLDVGTGAGVFAESFARLGLPVAGIDANGEMLLVARQHVPPGQLSAALAEGLPFVDGAFDLVFLALVLHEADSALDALSEARRVARRRVAVLEWPHELQSPGPPPGHRLPAGAVEDLAARAGYGKVETMRLSHMDYYRLAP